MCIFLTLLTKMNFWRARKSWNFKKLDHTCTGTPIYITNLIYIFNSFCISTISGLKKYLRDGGIPEERKIETKNTKEVYVGITIPTTYVYILKLLKIHNLILYGQMEKSMIKLLELCLQLSENIENYKILTTGRHLIS